MSEIDPKADESRLLGKVSNVPQTRTLQPIVWLGAQTQKVLEKCGLSPQGKTRDAYTRADSDQAEPYPAAAK